MMEVEVKVSLTADQADGLPAQLAALGFVPWETVLEEDLYYNAPDRDFRQTDEALRLRRVSGSRKETLLTYKGPKEDVPVKSRPEYETGITDAQTARSILSSLRFSPAGAVTKERRTFLRPPITACLDQVTGLGSFLELEHLVPEAEKREAAVEGLLELLAALEIPQTALERRSYLEMVQRTGCGEPTAD